MFIGAITCADSIARLTTALTPGTLFKAPSIVLTHEEQVIPVRCRSTCRLLTSFWAITELIVVRLLFFSYSTDNTRRKLSSLAKFWFVKPGQSFNAQVASLCEQFFGQCEIALVNSGNAEITLEG